jgi:hypothetical protein
MFVNLLDNEQKLYFGTLVTMAMHIDNEVAEEELEVIDGYKRELGLEELEMVSHDIDQVINYFKEASETVKNAVYLEVVTVVLADKVLKNEENELLDKLASAFGYDEAKKNQFIDTVKRLQHVYEEIFELVY